MNTRQPSEPGAIMTLKEVASYLRVHYTTLHGVIRRGVIPSFKIGGDYRFRRDAIEKWVAEESRPRKRSKLATTPRALVGWNVITTGRNFRAENRRLLSVNEVNKPPENRVYHNNSECHSGRDIPQHDRILGTNGYRLCAHCIHLNQQGR